jgi:hypothetical protein
MRFVAAIILSLSLPLHATAQAPRDAGRQPSPLSGTGVIAGRVTDRETGAPLHKVIVTLTPFPSRTTAPDARPQPRRAETDGNGRYAFSGLAAGAYNLLFAGAEFKLAYLPHVYGAPRPRDLTQRPIGRPLTVADGQTIDNADVALWRGLAIDGRIVDDGGDPLAGVQVMAVMAGASRPVSLRVMSDDRGIFRVFGLAPGRYLVCATPSHHARTGDDVRERYVKTCAPSLLSEADAQVVELTTGDFGGVEIRLQRSRAFRVAGVALDSEGAPVSRVSLVTMDGSMVTSSGTQADASGRFTFTGLTPGQYAVRAEVGPQMDPADKRERELGYTPFRIELSDLDGLVVTTAKGTTVTGQVVFEGAPAPGGRIRIGVRQIPGQDRGLMAGRPPETQMKLDQTFALSGVFGTPAIVVTGLPRGWIVKAVRLGGRDVTDQAADFRGDSDVEIVLSNRGAMVTGRIVPKKGDSVTDYGVMLLPAEPERWQASHPSALASAQSDGTYSVGPVRPGEYLVVLARPEELSLADDARRTLEELAQGAPRVR